MMMPYLLNIDASPSSSHTFKVEVPTRKGQLESHATPTFEYLLAGFFFRKEFLILKYLLKATAKIGSTVTLTPRLLRIPFNYQQEISTCKPGGVRQAHKARSSSTHQVLIFFSRPHLTNPFGDDSPLTIPPKLSSGVEKAHSTGARNPPCIPDPVVTLPADYYRNLR